MNSPGFETLVEDAGVVALPCAASVPSVLGALLSAVSASIVLVLPIPLMFTWGLYFRPPPTTHQRKAVATTLAIPSPLHSPLQMASLG